MLRSFVYVMAAAVVCLVLPTHAAQSVPTLPTGIPAPPFGLEESVRASYGSQTYSTHWVDSTKRDCSDASATGTPARPRCSLPDMASLAAGSVVQLRGGPYTLAAPLLIGGNGTASKPIFVRGDSAAPVTIQAGPGRQTIVARGSYIIVEHLKFTGRDEAFVFNAVEHAAVRDCEFVGTGTAVDGAGSVIAAGRSSFIVRARNTIHDAGDWRSTTENDMHGLGIGTGQHDVWDLYNTVYHVGGDGVGNGHDANHTTYNLFIGGNTFYENRENAVDLKEVHDVVISENVARNFTAAPGDRSSPGEAIVLHYGPTTGQGPYNVWVLNNLIHDSVIGIAASKVEAGHYWIGNVIYGCAVAISLNATSGGEFGVYHNTLADNGVGQWWGVNTDHLRVGGNIVSNATAGAHMRVDTSAQRERAEFSNELYYQGGRGVTIGWSKPQDSVGAWLRASGKGTGSLQADPLFTNPAAHDYTLQPASPAIGKGIDMSGVAAQFASAFGTSLLRDRAGHPRPNGVWDIGAYQSIAGGTRRGSE